jgi:hypothetical protein
MRTAKFNAILGFLLAGSNCSVLSAREVTSYIFGICWPNFSQRSYLGAAWLINSTFPCEVQLAMQGLCFANSTSPLDFLAEQECLCNGAWFDVDLGCSDCVAAHGGAAYNPAGVAKVISTLSSLECNVANPTQSWMALRASYYSGLPPAPSESTTTTSWPDLFPNNTAVSNYWTPTGPLTVGAITGSATGRATTTGIDTGIYFPSSDSTSTGSGPSASGGGLSASLTKSASSSTSSPSPSKNAAAMGAIGARGGLLTVVITFVVLA